MPIAQAVASSHQERKKPWVGPIRCPAALDLQDWLELPAIVDGVVSPDLVLGLKSALRAEAIAHRHPEWLKPYQATLVCAADVLRYGLAGPYLLETVTRLDLSSARRAQVERIAADNHDRRLPTVGRT
jgi:hypothetical protein